MAGTRLRVAAVAVLAGAALAAGQLVLAGWLDIITLDADFAAGAERERGAHISLVVWLCAIAVAVAAALPRAADRRELGIAAFGAAFGSALSAWPVVTAQAGPLVLGDARTAVPAGVTVGLAAALVAAVRPGVARGVAAHALLWWVLAAAALPTRSAAYPGLVEWLDLTGLRSALFPVLPGDRIFSYHLPFVLPSMLAVLALSGVLAARAGAAAGMAGPVLASAAFAVLPGQLTMWNGEVSVLAAATAVLAVPVVLACGRRRAARPAVRDGATRR